MSTLIQISDPHFGTERAEVVEALVRLVTRVQPELVVLSGDITQRARRRQFAAARRFVDRLGTRTLAIPGNHDIPMFNLAARCFWPYANFRREFGEDHDPMFVSDRLHVVCVDSTAPTRRKDGVLTAARIERVAERLRNAPSDRLRIVALHHPLYAITPHDVTNLAHGYRKAVPAWADAGADLILGGHIHLPYVRPLREHFPDIERDVWAVQAGTSLSHRTRGGVPNSVNVIVHERHSAPASCRVERWDYLAAVDDFDRVHETTILLDRPAGAASAA